MSLVRSLETVTAKKEKNKNTDANPGFFISVNILIFLQNFYFTNSIYLQFVVYSIINRNV
jgi:hypothetical protein